MKMRPLRTLAGAYLLYLACQQGRLFLRGEANTRGEAVVCIVSGAVFAAVGVWVLWREWKYAHAPDDSREVSDDSGKGSDTTDNSGEVAETEYNSGESPDAADDSGGTEDGV